MKNIKKYFQEVITELKKVTWPTKQQTIDKTLIVIGVSVAVAIYLGGLDYLFQRIMELLITK